MLVPSKYERGEQRLMDGYDALAALLERLEAAVEGIERLGEILRLAYGAGVASTAAAWVMPSRPRKRRDGPDLKAVR